MRSWPGFALALALLGCRGGAAEQPMAGDLELCCKAANDDNISFVGCRPTGHCRTTEEVWIRGPLTCSSDTPEDCAGGRCCKLDVEALAVHGEPPAPPNAFEHEPAPAPMTEPDSITPVPLDWQALPTAVFVPKLVCPATVERGVSGTVVLEVDVDEAGRVLEVSIRAGFEPECDALARDALIHAEFEPALSPAGTPIATSLRYEYSFSAAADGEH